ncbi:sulfite exporter TauE/SafE family protein [Campylobacter gastrosuis]|uniref:Probable membrane transporter protein n=1 Tax=Campylobacter gastrosuis TaxID=2974576 RepID=A0ABT7HPE1_9BACT|nr:sulfite exporter TauE/SafE family protein [Campylobacter gastrosuis]MDL0088769.1 sulfite exporter TauE/SafE family protein [Campylobacter gastrosuis]
MISFDMIFTLLALGAFVGLVAGMFGIGGGGVLVPSLTYLFLANGVSEANVVHIALGTSMACIIITSFSSFKTHAKFNAVKWDLFWQIGVGVAVGTFFGSFIASKINSFYLAVIFSIFMFYSAVKMFFSKTNENQAEKILPKYLQIISGLAIGIISSIVSIGGGILTVPFLTFQGIDIKKAIGTSAAVGFPIAIFGTIGYIFNGWTNTNLSNFTLGYVNLSAVLFITLTSYFFAPLGVKITHKIPAQKVKKIFALLPFTLSIMMLLKFI